MSSPANRPPDPPITVNSAAEIGKLASDIKLFGSRKREIRVQLAGLSEAENKALEMTISRHYSACGCGQGRISGVITLVGYLTLVITGVISVRSLGIGKTILLYFACATVAMIIGKAFGLWNARRSIIALSDQFQQTTTMAHIGRGG